jgi:hypothetical protein
VSRVDRSPSTDEALRETLPMTLDPPDANDADPPTLECRRCGRVLQPGRGELYAVSILAVADPWPPVYSEDDLALDTGAEIRRLIVQLSGQAKQQIQDQVYRRLVFLLCTPCYQRWIEDPTSGSSWE